MTTTWRRLGAVEPGSLVEGRLLLHHATQLVAAPGRSLLDPRPDHGHTALQWREELQALVGEAIRGDVAWRAALRPADLTLLVLDEPAESAQALLLAGRNLAAAWEWLLERARERGTATTHLSRAVPYAIPAHPVGRGAAFPPDLLPAYAEIARLFSNASRLFGAFANDLRGVTPVRCWPHHFDLGAVMRLDAVRGQDSPAIGFGVSLGDEAVAEPYWYVNAWPRPDALPNPLPPLPSGARWNVEGWLGAVLPGDVLSVRTKAAEQEETARGFLETGVRAATRLLGVPEG